MSNTAEEYDYKTRVIETDGVRVIPNYPLPWQVSFDWHYDMFRPSGVLWSCTISLGDEILAFGTGQFQIDALEEAVKFYKEKRGKIIDS